ncbi:hypothetical protein BDR07DRAFT_862512 [Suillus spraguei]|nr:hypothetical protein BDR07DRAFT_862512 [Suillus spraguei]
MKLVDVAVEISTPPAQGAISSASMREASKTSETGVEKRKRKANNDQLPKDGDTTVTPGPKSKKQKTNQSSVSKHGETAPTSKVASMDNFIEDFIEKLGRKEPAPVSASAESSSKPSARPEVLISTKAPVPTNREPPKKKPKNCEDCYGQGFHREATKEDKEGEGDRTDQGDLEPTSIK